MKENEWLEETALLVRELEMCSLALTGALGALHNHLMGWNPPRKRPRGWNRPQLARGGLRPRGWTPPRTPRGSSSKKVKSAHG